MLHIHSPVADEEVRKALLELREGRLVIGVKEKVRVTSLRQAIAIGLCRARRREAGKPAGEG